MVFIQEMQYFVESHFFKILDLKMEKKRGFTIATVYFNSLNLLSFFSSLPLNPISMLFRLSTIFSAYKSFKNENFSKILKLLGGRVLSRRGGYFTAKEWLFWRAISFCSGCVSSIFQRKRICTILI